MFECVRVPRFWLSIFSFPFVFPASVSPPPLSSCHFLSRILRTSYIPSRVIFLNSFHLSWSFFVLPLLVLPFLLLLSTSLLPLCPVILSYLPPFLRPVFFPSSFLLVLLPPLSCLLLFVLTAIISFHASAPSAGHNPQQSFILN